MIDSKELQRKVYKAVSEKRYEHIIGVKDTAACLAMRYGADFDSTIIAALLHDYCKGFSDKEMLSQAKRRHLPISKIEMDSPYLLHGKLAAAYGKEKFGITDPDILGAVTWHTTGKPAMSLLEMIIFTADYIEPNREEKMTIAPKIRTLAFKDLDLCCAAVMADIISYLKATQKTMDESTVDAYNYYRELAEKRQKIRL